MTTVCRGVRGATTVEVDEREAVLRANQQLRLARLALDADGDINLLADLPAAHASAALFAQTLELLAGYTNILAPQLHEAASEPNSLS